MEEALMKEVQHDEEDDEKGEEEQNPEGGKAQAEEMNILQRVWKEFGDKGNGNKTTATRTKDEVTQTCAICKWFNQCNVRQPCYSLILDHFLLTAIHIPVHISEAGMEDYEEHQDVIIGDNCVHMYHKDCLLKWMQMKHDFCPYCRSYVFPVPDFVNGAKELLGEERFKELVEQDDPELVTMYIGSTSYEEAEQPDATEQPEAVAVTVENASA